MLVDSALDFWLTTGRFAAQLERELARYLGLRHAILTNSGSSANLLALSALTSPQLGDRRLKPGDEVITVAAGFPTTVNPILQNRLTPVFLDVSLQTGNVLPDHLEAAVGPRTAAVMFAHTLGNPFDLDAVQAVCKKHDLWLIEDNCDALGSTYRGRLTGSFGDLATLSMYPAHHITTGEGGCVFTNKGRLKVLVESFRDWGRDCWCEPGKENTCGKRFGWQLGDLPAGYDHKYIYSHIGYNLKMTDMQAAIGVAQLEKLPSFIQTRRENWTRMRAALAEHEEYLILPEPTPHSDPELVRIQADRPRRRAVLAHRPGGVPRRSSRGHPRDVRRQPAAPAGLCRDPPPRRRRPRQYRHDHEQRLLDRDLSGGLRGYARLRARHLPGLLQPAHSGPAGLSVADAGPAAARQGEQSGDILTTSARGTRRRARRPDALGRIRRRDLARPGLGAADDPPPRRDPLRKVRNRAVAGDAHRGTDRVRAQRDRPARAGRRPGQGPWPGARRAPEPAHPAHEHRDRGRAALRPGRRVRRSDRARHPDHQRRADDAGAREPAGDGPAKRTALRVGDEHGPVASDPERDPADRRGARERAADLVLLGRNPGGADWPARHDVARAPHRPRAARALAPPLAQTAR